MTQLDSIKESIKGLEFEVFKLDPLTSLRALNVLKEAVGPALGLTLGVAQSLDEISDLVDSPSGGAKLGPALEQLLSDTTFDRQKALIDTFMPVTRVGGKQLSPELFSLIFRGDLPLMFAWLKLCLRGEWGNVLGAIRDAIGSAVALASLEKSSPSASESAGPSPT
jgi:hypothetical protein